MHQRDYEIALKLIELKKRNGYPDKFRTCWGKNTSERIFKIASLLQLNNLDKGVTLARQSNSEEVLLNIKRDNIKLEAYEFLEKNFNKLQVPVYAELIQGLPGETPNSWKQGINEMLSRGLNNQLFIYQAEVYPNTELGSAEYQDKFKIKTTKIRLNEIHCSPRGLDWVPEYQHIVTQTYSMTIANWREMSKFSLVTMLMHSMKAGVYILAYINRKLGIPYSDIIERVIKSEGPFLKSVMNFFDLYSTNLLNGEGRGLLYEKYSDVYLEPEEIALLMISENKKIYFEEIIKSLELLIPEDVRDEFIDVVRFQAYLIPEFLTQDSVIDLGFENNIPQYCYSIFNNLKIETSSTPSSLQVYQNSYSSYHEFTKKKIIWARKSGTILWSTNYENELKENMKVSFDIKDYANEKTFNISMFDEKINKFEKFSSIKNIAINKA
jgi:putative methyltransferase